MSQTAPEGWQRIEADPEQAELLELLHPVLELELDGRLFIGASDGCTGALLASPAERLRVRSIGNNVARVENTVTGETALVQVAQLAALGARPWSSGA